ncbi:MAG: aldo/keto reductase [Kiritimatiellae bacterium]|nr:aldo/keto reductase [Kiritimatiellia bacterium]
MEQRRLSHSGLEVSVVGFGAMAFSVERAPEADAFRVLHRVLDLGVTLIDTADTYGRGEEDLHHNERLVARALAAYRGDASRVCVATKGGTVRREGKWYINGAPERLYRAIRESHEALGGRSPIPLWQHHWPDPRYPVRDSMRAVRRAVEEGLVRCVGVSNYSVGQIKEARDVVDIASVQNQYNLWCRDPERDGVLEYCEKEDIVFFPWRPLGGKGLAQRLGDIRPLAERARTKGVSVHRLVIAWLRARSPCILPIPGTVSLDEAEDALQAADLHLSRDEVEAIDRIGPDDIPPTETDPRPRLPTTDFGS